MEILLKHISQAASFNVILSRIIENVITGINQIFVTNIHSYSKDFCHNNLEFTLNLLLI